MKKCIKKFIYSSLVVFVSIGINFDAEARLPKYMAQRAAELLIEKSGLQLKSTMLINDDYLKLKGNVILSSIASALQKYAEEDNIQSFLTSIIENMNRAKCEHKKEIERFTKAISDENIQSRLIVAIKALDKANEQFTEQVALALKDARIANEQAIYANELVEFLYSTKKRQHLANWMNNRIDRGQIKSEPVKDVVDTVNYFTDLFSSISEGYSDNVYFRTFVNQRFPCWTGTLTCFILNDKNTAKQILSLPAGRRNQDVYWKCKDGETTVDIRSQSTSARKNLYMYYSC